ncbi:hypothetical protein ACFO6R_03475 [Eubacterium multiforme]|uniref:Uncharacterized protein n=1 Tax=Eubacterium multiforme TaxID=83339 RepID=A0ABT9UNF7_9FIRM|nr:hypothetical protein [Eubacterium multiforme]MDQ0148181.1 hypothetical protein [Eubacterium multiforme]
MKIFAITYYLKEETHSCDCNDENHHHHHDIRDDYEITGHIKELGTWAHFMPTSFLLKSDLSANEILDKLKNYLEKVDLLFVTEVNENSVASLTPAVIEWIKK